ncbi:MAG: PAS domain S-box protein, partial [Bacteroidetes bacterium]|nr:PAS domain S-box protein [Bacteroidota bacterium]
DMDMNYIYVSQRYLKDYNVKEKDVIGKNHYDVFPDLPQKWRDVHQKVLAGEIFSEEDDDYEREDGSVDWTRWECRPWYEEEGTIGGLIVYTEVITEQKQILEALSKEKEFSEKIIKTSSAAIVGLDLNHRIKIFNKGLQDITGYEPSEVIGKDWFDIFFPSDIANEMNNVWKDAWGHSSHSYENLILGKTGEEKFISWQTTGLYDDPDINNHLLISIGEDITDRKQKDIELGKYRESLEDLVKERTIDLKNSQEALLNLVDDLNKESNELDKTNKQLIRLNEELEKFTYSVSHDLKAPLRGIDGYSQLLLDDFGNDLPQGAQEFLANIRKDTEQMNLLIEDLLAYSRMELKDFFLENINLNSLIDRNVSSFSKIFSSENFQIKLTIPNEFIITADKEGLNLILRNLIDNAIKFTSNRKNSSIEIGANETKTHWLIYVKDNGIGFDMIYHDKIYQIFQRLHLAEEYQGTGVGLAMVSKAINRMNGKIWAESSPNKGASFYIEIEKKI